MAWSIDEVLAPALALQALDALRWHAQANEDCLGQVAFGALECVYDADGRHTHMLMTAVQAAGLASQVGFAGKAGVIKVDDVLRGCRHALFPW
jgi:hypothetical protein